MFKLITQLQEGLIIVKKLFSFLVDSSTFFGLKNDDIFFSWVNFVPAAYFIKTAEAACTDFITV